MEFLDARRLTGPSLMFDGPAAILDIACDGSERDGVEAKWHGAVSGMLEALGWIPADFSRKDLEGGMSLAFTAPIDALYAATAINEWAWAVIEAGGDAPPDFDEARASIAAAAREEANPALLALQKAALAKGVTLLWDDDEVSLGLGATAKTWPAREAPAPDAIDWAVYSDVPVGLVTGTNGKTTTVRMATEILRSAGLHVGLSSTDWIAVDDRIIDRGDWSGPGGARAVLRQNDVDVAILESARGGLLRRGLGVGSAAAALITNISEDHLGDFGSRSLAELLDIKWIVSRPVRDEGRLILNADDKLLVHKAREYPGKITWFGLDPGNPVITEQLAAGGEAYCLDGSMLIFRDRVSGTAICEAGEIPLALGGAARHNVANALAAAALTRTLGAPMDAVRAGLTSMSQDRNPGRCNVHDIGGCKVLIDFAHNPQAMKALFDMAEALPARRRALCFGQAGDRPDELIRQLARDGWAIGVDRFLVSELAQYHRGRAHGEVYAILRDELIRLGARPGDIEHHEKETESVTAALDWAQPGDLVIVLALGGSGPVEELLLSKAG